ncbi:DUF397 domain-containing protein [Streptomyces specialis]|uniref:DUF397 domain-containing protein n=1 Tax=Streptomyces specialis TaxID=498367 RepID=UPI00073EC478|nr:DUF397 domain-containing protein [Streptomyces specialis]
MAVGQVSTYVWTKSSHSGGNGACVEVRSSAPRLLAVRDSKNPTGPLLGFPAGSWTAFLGAVSREGLGGI